MTNPESDGTRVFEASASSSCEHTCRPLDLLVKLLVFPCFAHESCIKGAIIVRGSVLKPTHVLDNDTTVHGEHTKTVAFSPSVLIKCSICSYHQTLTRTP